MRGHAYNTGSQTHRQTREMLCELLGGHLLTCGVDGLYVWQRQACRNDSRTFEAEDDRAMQGITQRCKLDTPLPCIH